MKRSLIFGSGPAGLLAAHASYQSGYTPDIVSSGSKSKLYGSQYLHELIPGLGEIRSTEVEHSFIGTHEGYRAKVYGTDWSGIVSPERYGGIQKVWDIRQAYDSLWEMYGDRVVHAAVTPAKLEREADEMIERYDAIISSIPLKAICSEPSNHKFTEGRIYAVGDAPDLDQYSPVPTPDDAVVCNGDPNVSWYRTSRIFGHSTAEWPSIGRKRPPISGVASVTKPLGTDCNCFPWVTRVGRYGTWTKGVLSHDAYHDAMKLLNA